LSPAAANSLLKIVEEPPPGFQFIFLATRRDIIVPTIVSRCLVHVLGGDEQLEQDRVSFCKFFTESHEIPKNTPGISLPALFDVTYEKLALASSDPLPLLDTIFTYWTKMYTKAMMSNDHQLGNQAQLRIQEIRYAYQHLPMPGSAKLFWRTLFLKITEPTHCA
jgi:hypothetical protein